MFFYLSKTLGLLLMPMYFGLALLALAGLLRLARRAPRLRRGLTIVAVVELWVLSTGAVANLLLYPLETYHARPASLNRAPAAIVMLAGLTDPTHKGPPGVELTAGADRFVEALRLAHAYPKARLILSGGSSAMLFDSYREAEALAGLARQLGFPARRLAVDAESRNTRENALESAKLLRGVKGPVLLVTSAYHMPRSVACFEQAGVDVIPWPVDYMRTGSGPGLAWLPSPSGLERSTTAIREYIGLAAYRLWGFI